MDFVIDFCWLELPGVEHCWVESSFVISLGEHCSNGKVQGICFEDGWLLHIEVGQDKCCGELMLQLLEYLFCHCIPHPL